jgi:hypothetical protein
MRSLRTPTNILTCIFSVRQRLTEHVPERYAVNKNRRALTDNGFSYHGTRYYSSRNPGHVTVCTVAKSIKVEVKVVPVLK